MTGEMGFRTYEALYGMREPPFTLTPNPAFFFVNERSREGVAQIESGILKREGFALVCGDVGTGKTTLCWALLEKLDRMNVCTALVQNPTLSATDILKCILNDLGVRPRGVADKPEDVPLPFDTSWMAGMGQMELIERLNAFLIQAARKGLFTVVIIDEAQALPMETLEQLRLLSNLELSNRKLLQIIFVGQLELDQMLQRPELRQLNQRISVRFETRPFNRKDSEAYIRHRLHIAGAIPRLQFKKGAFDVIYRLSQGYPRLINMICDRALSYAFREESYVVTAAMVRRGFDSIRGKSAVRVSIGFRKLLPIAGILAFALLIISLVVWKRVAPGTDPTPQSTVASSGLTSAASTAASPEALPEVAESRPEPNMETAPGPGAHDYVLQVSSFRGSVSAQAAADELKAKGLPSFYKYQQTQPDGGWFAVYAGPFQELADAMKAASTLQMAEGEAPLLKRRIVN